MVERRDPSGLYNSVCKPQMEKLACDVGLIREKIFNGHSTSIIRIEKEVGEIKKLLLGMVAGCFTVLLSIVIYVVFGFQI